MYQKLRSNWIEPMVTLWHFELLAWLEQEGSLVLPLFSQKFRDFCEFAASGLKEVCYWFMP
jgi:beta-glucosidase/6-phospho-beta-glucosidase/beta-galactosidase